VNPGISRWFSSDGKAVVGYVRKNGVRVVAGAPVCASGALEEVMEEWRADCTRKGDKVCYFAAAGRIKDYLDSRGDHSTVCLGAQPVWKPADWEHIIGSNASLRAQLNRAVNKGVTVTEWSGDRATRSPLLQRCLDEWLTTRGLPPLHFLVEPETLGLMVDRRVFVASLGEKPVGFLVLCPVPLRNGWLTEQFPRGKGAPNGTVELLLDFAARTIAAEGADYLTMGLVPLSNHGDTCQNTPGWLRLLLGWVRAHGRRFYNFGGLEWFKAKFQPELWEPIYAISDERRFSFRTLYAISAAFSDGSPIAAVGRGLHKAVAQEITWFAHGR
jgi:phosphatidylglycerol lysyltransferase